MTHYIYLKKNIINIIVIQLKYFFLLFYLNHTLKILSNMEKENLNLIEQGVYKSND